MICRGGGGDNQFGAFRLCEFAYIEAMELFALEWLDLIIVALGGVVAQLATTVHILYTKDEVRSAIAWVAVVWLTSFIGVLVYLLFGISRIRRRAVAVRQRRGLAPREGPLEDPEGQHLGEITPDAPHRWLAHDRLAGRVAGTELTAGNIITPFEGGRAAYDAMVSAIDQAEHTVALTTYIFQADQAGRKIISALVRAKERGVDVKVLVDAVGNMYGLKPVSNLLRRRGIDVVTFNPARLSWRLAFFNLRTHRKLLIIDGTSGFAGGMNIRKHHLEGEDGTQSIRDTHFGLNGPIVTQMTEAFADDWLFSSKQKLDEALWLPNVTPISGGMAARSIPDGPDEPQQKTAMIIESALASARDRVQIITPYFLPEQGLLAALKQAALRGVTIDILLPLKSNLPLFSMAALAGAKQLIEAGCRVFLSPPPFDHSKLMIVDSAWALFGSSNWDARSLKLNFEFNIECYDARFAVQMTNWVQPRFDAAKAVSLQDLKNRRRSHRVLGRIMWLASPYL